jgi:predicted ATPase
VWRQLGDRPIEDLAGLPMMTDPLRLSTLEVLASLQAPARFTDEHLPRLAAGRMTNISLEHGNSDASPLAYVRFGQLLTCLGDYQNGLRFGKLGVDLVEKVGLGRFKSRVYLAFGHSISPWNSHVNISLGELRLAFEAAQEVGDLTFASYARSSIITLLLFAGDPLNSVDQQCEDAAAFIQKALEGRRTASARSRPARNSVREKPNAISRQARGRKSPPVGTGSGSCRRVSSRTNGPPRRLSNSSTSQP